MPGMITVSQSETFRAMVLVDSDRKIKFGTEGEVATTAAGVPQWTAQIAVSYFTEPGQRAQGELITVTVSSSEDPFAGLDMPSAVVFEQLRCGVSAAEANGDGRVRGGKLYWSGSGIRSAAQAFASSRPAKGSE